MPIRAVAQRELRLLSTAQANAEEAVLYPELVRVGEQEHATASFSEHGAYKLNLGELVYLDPMSQDADKVGYIWQATRDHVCEEEGTRFLELRHKAPQSEQEQLTSRFSEKFKRCLGPISREHCISMHARSTHVRIKRVYEGPSPREPLLE